MTQSGEKSAIERLRAEFSSIQSEEGSLFVAGPVSGEDFLNWHFSIKGPRDSSYKGGIFHGKLVFTREYPQIPPDIYFLTPNGRFEVGKKVDLPFLSNQCNLWNPSWNIRTLLMILAASLPSQPIDSDIGSKFSESERRRIAFESRSWSCNECRICLEPDDIFSLEEVKEGKVLSKIFKDFYQEEEEVLNSKENVTEEIANEENTENDDNINVRGVEEEQAAGDCDEERQKKGELGVGINHSDSPRFRPYAESSVILLFLSVCFLIINISYDWIHFI